MRTLLLALAVLSLSSPATARTYKLGGSYYATQEDCEHARRKQHTKGMIIGGVAGAVAGGALSDHDDKALGIGLGGLGGALLGRSVTGTNKCQPIDRYHYKRHWHREAEPVYIVPNPSQPEH